MQERRTEARMLCADMVEASWSDRAGRPRRATALLEDISARGACLQFERRVPLGTSIRVHCGRCDFTGVIRYCVFREIGWFAGVEFDTGSRWSKARFLPQHLLDLRKLLQRRPPRLRVN